MKKSASNTSKSLKTFYLYAIIVFIVIVISLVIKVFYIIQQSKFDPMHQFTLAITEQKNVKEIVSFHPQTPSVAILVIQNESLAYDTLERDYGIPVDGYIQTEDAVPPTPDVVAFMWSSLLHTTLWQSDLTAYDKIRLLLLAKNITPNNKAIDQVSLTKQNSDNNTVILNALTDQDIANENISVQVINATNISGFGQRLDRILTNMGANVIDVSTAQQTQPNTTIQYFGNDSYTLERIQKIVGVTATKLAHQPIADIIITLGDDKQNTTSF